MTDSELTPEEENAAYLSANPAIEGGLWAEWVLVVCGWEKITKPTDVEWGVLRRGFYPGKAPVDSVVDLKRMRAA
jgi:hypothetical protein